MKSLLRDILPYGVITRRRRAKAERTREALLATRPDYHERRRKLLAEYNDYRASQSSAGDIKPFDYENAVRSLVALGLDEEKVRRSTIPESGLKFALSTLEKNLDIGRPVTALHVGNFLGISLCALAGFLRDANPDSMVVAIDPNITHVGINAPHRYVSKLAEDYGLLSTILPIASFSWERNAGDFETTKPDQLDIENPYDDLAFDNALPLLTRCTAPHSFGVALIDGFHEADYLENELTMIRPLLTDGAIVILDDVNDAWADLKALYQGLDQQQWTDLGTDGRLGVLKKVGD
ncbi:MAG: class I SAM-dependent methyltransferase [Alphaproteobacteria bacterium]